jgi:hypothetical protein
MDAAQGCVPVNAKLTRGQDDEYMVFSTTFSFLMIGRTHGWCVGVTPIPLGTYRVDDTRGGKVVGVYPWKWMARIHYELARYGVTPTWACAFSVWIAKMKKEPQE